jgi:Flp pilus assembly protein TadD
MNVIENILVEAIEKHQKQELAEASLLYEKVLNLAPDHVDALNLQGLTFAQLGKPDRALALIRKAISLNPEDSTAYNNLGILEMAHSRNDMARAFFQSSQSLNPMIFEANFNNGYLSYTVKYLQSINT